MHPDKRNEFDKQLAEKFDHFRPDVPGGLWEKIATELDNREQAVVVPMKVVRRRPARWLSAAAAVLVVCSAIYWYNRPVAVTYLQGTAAQANGAVAPTEEMTLENTPVQETTVAAPEIEPLDIDRLKQLFTRRKREGINKHQSEGPAIETQPTGQPAGTTIGPSPTAEDFAPISQALAKTDIDITTPTIHTTDEAMVAATMPVVEPPVAPESAGEAETLLAAGDKPKQAFGVSSLLNYVVGAVDQREEKLISFSDDGEGSLKLDFNFSLAKNKRNR